MKQLRLISPVAPRSLMGGDFYFRLPPLGPLKVAALTPPGWEVRIIDEKCEPLDFESGADLVGITAMTPTAPRAYEIADQFRARGVPVIMGGMHASVLPEEALQHCDSVLIGEAEGLWPSVLADCERGSLQRIYRHNGTPPNLEHLPRPDWRLYQTKRYLPVHFVETTRGCPHGCEFCAVTNAFGGKFRNRPLEEVDAELRSLEPFGGLFTLKNAVFFVDDNIVSNRAYAKQFFERIADLNLKWFGQASVNVARDPEILRLAKRSGCVGVFIGFETLSPECLSSAGKNFNRPQDYLDVIHRIHDHGIGIDGSFVFGFDHDDEGVFDRTLEFVIRAKLEIAFFSILTPYPGTRLYERVVAENRLLTRDWRYYDSSRVVHEPRCMSADKLQAGYLRVLREFYSWSSIFKRLWGTTSYKNFFYPMNFGFRQSVRRGSPPNV